MIYCFLGLLRPIPSITHLSDGLGTQSSCSVVVAAVVVVVDQTESDRGGAGTDYWRSVARSFSSTDSREASDRSVAWMYFCTPTNAFFSASNEEEYNIFFLTWKEEGRGIREQWEGVILWGLTLAVSGHHDIRKSFCFFELSVVPWHWCIYSKSNRPYLEGEEGRDRN